MQRSASSLCGSGSCSTAHGRGAVVVVFQRAVLPLLPSRMAVGATSFVMPKDSMYLYSSYLGLKGVPI